jgi:hypothetical protein
MEPIVGPRIIGPEIIEQVIVIIVVVDLVANVVGAIAQLLLTLGAPVATTIGQVRAKVTTIFHTHGLAVAATFEPILTIVGSKVAILATRITEVRTRVGSVADAIRAIIGNRTITGAFTELASTLARLRSAITKLAGSVTSLRGAIPDSDACPGSSSRTSATSVKEIGNCGVTTRGKIARRRSASSPGSGTRALRWNI